MTNDRVNYRATLYTTVHRHHHDPTHAHLLKSSYICIRIRTGFAGTAATTTTPVVVDRCPSVGDDNPVVNLLLGRW